MADRSLTELIRIYFKAYETKDRSALESTLSDDFTSPVRTIITSIVPHFCSVAGPTANTPGRSTFASFSIAETKPLSSTIWSRTTDNLFAIRNSSPEAAVRSKRSKCILVRKSGESRTSSNSLSRTQVKTLESRSARSTARLASVSIGCQ